MNLKDFVSSTLLQIIQGADDAMTGVMNMQANMVGAYINPREEHSNHAAPMNVEFDVAVTVTSGMEGNAKAGIKVVGFQIRGGAAKAYENQAVSRIKFSVPMTLPSQPVAQYQPVQQPIREPGMYDHD